MTQIATMAPHADQHSVVVVRTPPGNGGELMTGFEPATYSSASRGYLMHTDHIPNLRRWLSRSGVHLVDERSAGKSKANPNGAPCPVHGNSPCPAGVPFHDWAARHPEEAREMLDGLDAIKARSRGMNGGTT